MTKKIGIDARFYGEAGPGRYVKNIITGLEKEDKENTYYIFLRDRGMQMYNPVNPNFGKIRAEYVWYSFAEQTGFLRMLMNYRLDMLYVPHFNIPVFYPGTIVTAIPDLIMHTFSTEKGTTLPRYYFKFKKLVYGFVVAAAVRRSKCVIVPSNAVKNDFINIYKSTDPDKFVVAYEGVDADLFNNPGLEVEQVLSKYRINKPYILYISSMYEHKNVFRLLDTFKTIIGDRGYDIQLVLVGKKDKYSDELQQYIEDIGLGGKVIMPGQASPVDDRSTAILRKNALLYVFPSLKEGFSLTPLEAQAFGLPCVISDIDVHREVYNNSVSYFNPESSEDMTLKILELLKNEELRQGLISLGLENAKKYSWERAAKTTLACFKRFM